MRRALVILVVAVLVPAALRAQAVKGSLVGNITDSAGLAIPGATVTITEVNTNINAATTTNENGFYVFSSLKDGVYRGEAELTGFKKAGRDKVEGQGNTTMRADLKLE